MDIRDNNKEIFEKAGMNLQDETNIMFLEGHKGRHANEYHEYILNKLSDATNGLSGQDYKDAVYKTLEQLKKEIMNNPDIIRGAGLP